MKKLLASAPVLQLFEWGRATRVIADASDACAGAVLEQEYNGVWKPVEYYSKRFNSAECNYSATDREFAAIRHAL